jgi:hypothetical protein
MLMVSAAVRYPPASPDLTAMTLHLVPMTLVYGLISSSIVAFIAIYLMLNNINILQGLQRSYRQITLAMPL